jgi:hypothetical protein
MLIIVVYVIFVFFAFLLIEYLELYRIPERDEERGFERKQDKKQFMRAEAALGAHDKYKWTLRYDRPPPNFFGHPTCVQGVVSARPSYLVQFLLHEVRHQAHAHDAQYHPK